MGLFRTIEFGVCVRETSGLQDGWIENWNIGTIVCDVYNGVQSS